MNILIINSVCGIGSTGRICGELAEKFEKEGNTVKIAYGRSSFVPDRFKKYSVRIGNSFSVAINALKSRLYDNEGLNAKCSTKKFLKWADKFNPDLVWLHNIHGYYVNYELLFEWIKTRPDMQVKWTLHDCWAFTGHCSYFSAIHCDKWKTTCGDCAQKNNYPRAITDNSCGNLERKKRAFTGVKNMTLITPSKWLSSLVKQSFLKDYPVEVRYNEIDRSVFKPTESDFREKYCLTDKKIVLGVASNWNERKGLNDYIKLADIIGDEYKVVLVGLNKKQIKYLPKKILGIERTNDPKELAAVYTAADVFLNLSKEETFGMTTLEAKTCGTEVIVYKDTACEEIVDAIGGYSVVQCDLQAVKKTIEDIIKANT